MALDDVLTLAKRLHIGTVAWAAFILAAGTAELAFGFWPSIHPGFVRADTFKAVTSSIDEHQALNDLKSIYDLKARECALPKDAPKDVYRDRINEMGEEYRELTNKQPVNTGV